MTGISRGFNSAVRTAVNELRAEIMLDSGRWKAGERLAIMLGVRTRTDGLIGSCVGVMFECGCDRGRIWRSGRKVCRVRIGVRRRVFRRSERVEGERVAMGWEG